MKSSHLVPNQNKSHLVIDRPDQSKAGQLVPNQTKLHLIIGWSGQTKSGQMKYHHLNVNVNNETNFQIKRKRPFRGVEKVIIHEDYVRKGKKNLYVKYK